MPRSFDGVDDDLDLGSDASVDDIFAAAPNTGTIAFWFNRTSTGFDGIVTKGDDATTGWSVYFRGAGGSHTLAFHHRWTTSGRWQSTTQFSGTGTWFHAAVTYNGSSTANDPTIWINGVSETVNEFSTPATTIGSDAANILTICDMFDAGAPANLVLANVAVSQTIWTQQQVLNHMRWGRPGGNQLVVHPLLTDKVTNEGTGVADATVTGATVVGFYRVMRPGCGGI